MRHSRTLAVCLAVFLLALSTAAAAQDDPATAVPQESQPSDDAVLRLAEPDYRLINTPTTLVLPRNRGAFELTHRFNENLAKGSFGSHADRLFGIDAGAVVGFEFRFGILRRVQAAAYRTTIDQTLQLHGKWDAFQQGEGVPVSVSALLSIEGNDNFREDYAPALGAVVGRTFGEWAAVYASPVWVHNTGAFTETEKRDTGFVGLGTRLRIRPTVYLTGEVTPRVGGYESGEPEFAFAIEKRAGGHLFQLNFANTVSTTYRHLARGGFSDSLFLGFNIARKFF
jgi:Membrane bound beta barrel domain (DUF5777)